MFDSITRLEASDHRPQFDCGDDDLNEFFHIDSKHYAKELLAVTYLVIKGGKTVAYFSVLNDAIKKEDNELPKSALRKILKPLPREKRFKNIPSVKIGRLAVCRESTGESIGSRLLDFVKYWFKTGNKTGCRFLVVDAYNNEKTINFYMKNGFKFMTGNDVKSKTRIMYFDLASFTPT